jgi:hypothetical protein
MAHLWMIYLLINTTVTTVNVLILDLRKRSPPPNIFNTFIFPPKIPKEWISHWKNPKPSTRKQIPDGIIFPLKHQRNNYSLQPKCPFLVEFHGFSSFSCVLFPEGRLYPPRRLRPSTRRAAQKLLVHCFCATAVATWRHGNQSCSWDLFINSKRPQNYRIFMDFNRL